MKVFLDKYLNKLFRASVLKNMGVDIPSDHRLNCSTKKITIDKSKDNYVVYFALPFDPDLWQALNVDNRAIAYDGIWNTPDKECKCRDIIEITFDDISKMIAELPESEVVGLERWMSKESREAYEAKKEAARKEGVAKIKGLPLANFTKEDSKANFLHLLYCLRYSAEDNQLCWDAYNKDWTDFPGKPDYVSNSRAFYFLRDNEYLVISKNLYDVFFASQGNGFESCFSLTSSHRYIRGVPYWQAHDGYYMCYITDGDITKWSAIPGHKLKLPKMSARAWGYRLTDGFGIGKTYDKTNNRDLMWKDRDICNLFPNCKPTEGGRKVDGEEFDCYRYSVYYDNLTSSFHFRSYGMNGQGSASDIMPVYEALKRLKFNENIQFFKRVTIVDGLFVEKKVLPKSGLVDTKINRVIEDRLAEPTNIKVQYVYRVNNGDLECSLGTEIGEQLRSVKGNAIFMVIYTQSGQIILKKDDEDETVIASV